MNPLETMTDRVIVQCAREVILVADHTKFGKVATSIVALLITVHKIITDEQTPLDMLEELCALGIQVIQA
ncbi:DeoR/GlpR transcriptional regulator [Ktedonobacter robiniae]|nr:DeoR/GlpR transcriptional regulator [Ktedonobacter robiniae]